jgi:hypothetical protein
VYVVSKSAHDFSDAERYGTLIPLSSGPMNRYNVNNIHRQFADIMSESTDEDYILICGLSIMSSVACGIMAAKHGRLNMLLFRRGKYVERNLVLEEENDNQS